MKIQSQIKNIKFFKKKNKKRTKEKTSVSKKSKRFQGFIN